MRFLRLTFVGLAFWGSVLSTNAQEQPKPKLNLNTSTNEQFMTIPNMGPQMLREFNEYKPYISIAQFRREMGKYIDAQKVAEYEKYVFVPINRNDSDKATVMQIPGLTEAEADQLIAGRPYATHAAFLTAVSKLVTAEERTTAEAYLSKE